MFNFSVDFVVVVVLSLCGSVLSMFLLKFSYFSVSLSLSIHIFVWSQKSQRINAISAFLFFYVLPLANGAIKVHYKHCIENIYSRFSRWTDEKKIVHHYLLLFSAVLIFWMWNGKVWTEGRFRWVWMSIGHFRFIIVIIEYECVLVSELSLSSFRFHRYWGLLLFGTENQWECLMYVWWVWARTHTHTHP